MNTTEVKENWERQRSKLLKKFLNLTERDLILSEGSKEAMFGRLQIKLGKTEEEMHRIIAKL
jgi:hypothetical protein